MTKLAGLWFLLVVIVISSELTEARRRVRSRSSRTRRSGSTSRTRRHFSPAGSSKVTKNTPIPVLTKSSPVIKDQTKLSPRSHLYRNSFFAYMFYDYPLKNMPVYRGSYNMPNSVIQIPEERATRVSRISEYMRDIDGSLCLGYTSKSFTLVRGVSASNVQTRLFVDGNLRLIRNDPELTDITLDKDWLDKDIQVRSFVVYDGNMVANTMCRQVESNMEGTIIRMYATNPDAAGTIQCSLIAVTLSSILYFFFLS